MFDPWKDTHDHEEVAVSPGNALQLTTNPHNTSFLLVIFIHGFKGDDKTFDTFPQRIHHILSESLLDTAIECIVFPSWETKGELTEAVARFVEWLILLTVEKEQGKAGSASIVLCGHSMGGFLAADSLLELAHSRRDGKTVSLWPRIVACISFDTPFLGVHRSVLENSVTKAAEVVNRVQTVGSTLFGALAGLSAGKVVEKASPAPETTQGPKTGWSKWAAPAAYAIGGAALAGAAVGSAWYKREDLGQGYQWATDHMKFIGNLWDEKVLQKRLNDLVGLEKSLGIYFRALYVSLPPTPPRHLSSRTFILLPKLYTPAAPHFLSVKNGLATNEIQAHTGMFAAATNDGYYELGLDTAKIIREALASANARIQR
ncbi:hypothetical protein AX15_002353 [Amanita polypyramis BW_CC]|nr:hypothetical protein AX15_002353 [Amanita polypyramis BW_CC]